MTRLGVLGGMGPLASARFLVNLYEHHRAEPGAGEQGMPQVVLLSDPSVPDRTAALAAGRHRELAERLTAGVEQLLAAGADRVVIACITVHRVLDLLAPELRARVASLLDLVCGELAAGEAPTLMLTTSGTRDSGAFQTHAAWPELGRRARWPEEEDQERVHRMIYELKSGADPRRVLEKLDAMVTERYGAPTVVYGCTELHLLPPHGGRWLTVDPLWCVIRRLPEILAAPTAPAASAAP